MQEAQGEKHRIGEGGKFGRGKELNSATLSFKITKRDSEKKSLARETKGASQKGGGKKVNEKRGEKTFGKKTVATVGTGRRWKWGGGQKRIHKKMGCKKGDGCI